MRRFLIILVIVMFGASLMFGLPIKANAHLGMFVEKFSWKPYSKWIIDGRELTAKTTELGDNSYFIEWLEADGKTAFYATEKYNSQNRIVSQWGPYETAIIEYNYDKDGKLISVLMKRFWPELSFIPVSSNWEFYCDPKQTPECYTIEHIETLITATRDGNGKVIGGVFRMKYFLRNGRSFATTQAIKAEYPNENTMRITFVGFGEPWTYCDKWQEYRLKDGKLIWEICRSGNIAPGECK